MGLDAHTGIQARFAAANRPPVPTLGQRQSLRALQHDMRSKKQKNIVDMLHLGKLTVYNNRKARSFFVKGVGGCEKNEAEGRNIGWDVEGIPDTGCCHVAADILCIMRPDGVAPCERRG